MRIGYLIPEFPSQTQISFWREIEALKRLGAEVQILSTSRPPRPSRQAFAQAAAQETVYLCPPLLAAHALCLMRHPKLLLRMMTYALGAPGLSIPHKLRLLGMIPIAMELLGIVALKGLTHIHVHSCGDIAHLVAMAAKQGSFRFSLTLHSDLPDPGIKHQSKFQQAKFVAVVARSLQSQVQACGIIPDERIPLIRMGVDVRRFLPSIVPFGDCLRMITVARLTSSKGHIVALQAMRKAIDEGLDLRYTIVGEGEARPLIEATIAALGLQDRVFLVGTAGEDEVLEYLHASDIFLLPSVSPGDAAPVALMEAMACGLPVISSIIGGTAEMICSGRDGILVPRDDACALSEAIATLARDQKLFQNLQTEARRTAEQSFAVERSARMIQDAILA